VDTRNRVTPNLLVTASGVPAHAVDLAEVVLRVGEDVVGLPVPLEDEFAFGLELIINGLRQAHSG
jgi:hypothetical protein